MKVPVILMQYKLVKGWVHIIGRRHRDNLSPLLFIVVMNDLMKKNRTRTTDNNAIPPITTVYTTWQWKLDIGKEIELWIKCNDDESLKKNKRKGEYGQNNERND